MSPEDQTASRADVTDPAEKKVVSGVFELKFLVDLARGSQIQEWARQHMQPDPHSDSESGFGYAVNSLYLDTPAFDVLQRVSGFRQRKYRLRRYGTEATIWMELKRKHFGCVTKRRSSVSDQDLQAQLTQTQDPLWAGKWFQNRLEKLQLQPVCQVTYERFACIDNSPTGTIRLTLDSDLSCRVADGWNVPAAPLSSNLLLQNQQVLELKYHHIMPDAFRNLIDEFQLQPGTFSKYRQSVAACMVSPPMKSNSMPL